MRLSPTPERLYTSACILDVKNTNKTGFGSLSFQKGYLQQIHHARCNRGRLGFARPNLGGSYLSLYQAVTGAEEKKNIYKQFTHRLEAWMFCD